jgi:hypothetical protein
MSDKEWSTSNLLNKIEKGLSNSFDPFNSTISWLRQCALTNSEAKKILDNHELLITKSDQILEIKNSTNDCNIVLLLLSLKYTKKYCQIIKCVDVLINNELFSELIERIIYTILGDSFNILREKCVDCCNLDTSAKKNHNDHLLALEWYLRAAKLGSCASQLALSILLDPDIDCVCKDGKNVCSKNVCSKNVCSKNVCKKEDIEDEKEALKWNKLAADQGNSSAIYNLSVFYYNLKEYKQSEQLLVQIVGNKEDENPCQIRELLFQTKCSRYNYGDAIQWCAECIDKGDKWAIDIFAKICWNDEFIKYGFDLTKPLAQLAINRFETGLNLFCRSRRENYQDESLDLDLPRNNKKMIQNICGQGSWPKDFNIEKDNFEPCLEFVDRQNVLIEVANHYSERKDLIKHLVYNYGLDWKKYYSKYPLGDVTEFQKVTDQHHDLTELVKCVFLPREIQKLVFSHLPWFSLVEEESQCGRKRKFS